ncbi:replication initiator protein A [Apilactobacillus ozensis]|uniref:replication initiator protein A n=1 Tax=Apilactobacillus ozensis TaxID=866801 RepID=UPI00200B7C64|nr:replication initiator protein A [Apilactobacillus ozensis]MCK8607244.1 replication initiator protein A [Apilactobacillus ozensis]
MNQFVQLDMNVLKNNDLNSDEKITLSLILDRMKSSIKRLSFYDDRREDYYVVYPIQELMDILGVGKNTVIKVLKKLEYLGLIIKQRAFNQATRIFISSAMMAKNIVDEEIQKASVNIKPSKSQKINFNQKINHKKYNNTVNTESAAKNESVVDKIKQWSQATQQKLGLTFSSIQAIQKFCKNNVEKCKNVVRLILNARNAVAKQNQIAKSNLTQFESNLNIKHGLANQLDHIFSYALNLPKSNYAGYVTNALKTYFTQAFGLETNQTVKPKMHQVKFNNGQKHIHEELPEWAKDDYVYTPDEHVDEKKKAELKAMLADL